ncbi:hypothetical protein RB653_009421 [Dictyostelium firmibasis]|uniref:Uncharacterized protein n=1 Tax=Dictyostelium firmibasis TaxID=79012 RepID=A0AAN7U653_9MYCE
MSDSVVNLSKGGDEYLSNETINLSKMAINPSNETINLSKETTNPSNGIINLSKSTKVELRFRCMNLKDMDTFSKSDPQIFVYEKQGNSISPPLLIGSTEKINNNLNPVFKKTVTLDYHFEKIQNLRFEVLDIDGGGKSDTIGDFSITLGNIISKPGKKVFGDVKHNGKKTGTIEIIAEEIQETGHNIILKLQGSKLDKKDLFSSDPFYKIFKTSPNGNLLVYQSPVIKSNINPIYDPIILKLEELNGGDMFRELTFEFWDHDTIGDNDFIGSFKTTTDEILKGQIREFSLINPKKQSKSSYKNSGKICFTDARLVGQPTFIDFLSGGCEINLMIAIDCTSSNGTPTDLTSLHYNTPTHESEYARSIIAVGNVLAPYDSDGKIELLGFGAERFGGSTSHCFQFGPKAEARGIEEVLSIYNKVMPTIKLSYPTNFQEIIKHAAKKSVKGVDSKNQKYTILLILTDGDITDMEDTIEEIVKASNKAPLSIVIVGVGSSSFSKMNRLDGDDEQLCDRNGVFASRDIVQFVPFKEFENNSEQLAAETLREIPEQLVGYMKSQNYFPNILKN